MKRGKPHQQYYKPGSGPLRKSGQGIDETESDTNILAGCKGGEGKGAGNSRGGRNKSEGSSPREVSGGVERLTGEICLDCQKVGLI